MKSLFLLLSLLTLTTNASVFSKNELQVVAQEIDNICGDTWCEGDFNWNHYDLKCDLNTESCTIELDLVDEFYMEDSSEKEITDRFVYEKLMLSKYKDLDVDNDSTDRKILMGRTCTISGIKSKQDVVVMYNDRVTYSEKMYDGVLDCVTSMEEEYWLRQENI